MPLVYTQKIDEVGSLLVWKITESDQFFQEKLCSLHAYHELNSISHPLKKREWLAGRFLYEELCRYLGIPFKGIYKDEHGKPFLSDTSFHTSITHTDDYVAIVAHPQVPVGIDMEKPSDKLIRVQQKFLIASELFHAQNDLSKLVIYWSAKEALYKLNGRKKVPFSAITIAPFHTSDYSIEGVLQDQQTVIKAKIEVLQVEHYYLTVASELSRVVKSC